MKDTRVDFVTSVEDADQKNQLLKEHFFEKTAVSFEHIFYILHGFSCQLRIGNVATMHLLPKKTVIQYYVFFSEICSWKLLNDTQYFSFGGPGTVVQIDECCISRSKYHRGRRMAGSAKWVLGIYDCSLRRGIIIYIQNRSAEVIIPLICKYVKPGTEIWTDMFTSYSQLGILGQVSPYIHKTVNHSQNFIDPVTGVCTNNVEGYWSRLKGFLRRLGVMHSSHLPLYIDYFMWLTIYNQPGTSVFQTLLQHLKEKYRL